MPIGLRNRSKGIIVAILSVLNDGHIYKEIVLRIDYLKQYSEFIW